ncbi:integrin alpha-9-like [Liolophura sinensis]|uniref:integrin alpha-9-like n=1 Tax=Liolophura sinensis TaxID=3198878 RepID=UPI0031590510
MRIDTRGNGFLSRRYDDYKEHQWLGSSLALSYDTDPRLVACAPQWKNKYHPGHYLVQGLCYYLKDGKTEELRPLLDPKLQVVKDVHHYAYAQAGFSVTFAKEKTDDKAKLIMGVPNMRAGQGGVVAYEDTTNDVFKVKDLFYGSAYAGELETDSLLQPNTNMCYAVTSGKIYGPGKVTYIIGAPVDRRVGKIYLIDNKKYEVNDSRTGAQFGEYYGASLCTVDFDGDGLDDVVVGAPLFSSDKYPDVGKVYVYINRGKGLGLSSSTVTLTSPGVQGKPLARFGQVVASIGDINQDGCEDLAVGAPYEDDKVGAVYIYNGSPGGLKREISQRIGGNAVKDGIQTFGWSISRGQDMDGNGYPDFAVGAYHTNNAILLRSRPVVKVDGKLDIIPSLIDYTAPPPIPISVILCLNYSGVQVPGTLYASFALEADTLKRSGSRAKFHTDHGLSTTIQKRIILQAITKTCTDITTLITATFQHNCGGDDVCVTDLQVKFAEVNTEGSTHLILGQTSALVLQILVSNAGEPAYEALLTVRLPPRVTYVGGGNDLGPAVFSPTSSTLTIDLGNPLSARRNATLKVNLNVDNVPKVTTHLHFRADITSTSHEKNRTSLDNKASITVPAMYEVKLMMESQSFPEQLTYNPIEEEELPLLNMTQKLSLQNTGPSLLPGAEITISIPFKKREATSSYLDPSEIEVFMWNEASVGSEPVSCAVSDSNLLSSGDIVQSEDVIMSTTPTLTMENITEMSREVTENLTLPYLEPQRRSLTQNKTVTEEKRQVILNCSSQECVVVTCQLGQLLVGQTVQVNVSLRVNQAALDKRQESAVIRLETSISIQRKTKPGFPKLLDNHRLETTVSFKQERIKLRNDDSN